MRLFIAADLPAPIKRQLVDLRNQVSRGVKGVKWVEDQNLHLTLKFLGEVDDSLLPKIIEQSGRVISGSKEIRLSLGEIGYFPNKNNPRVVWEGLKGETDKINSLGTSLDKALETLGFEIEKSRKAHLTLGRIKLADGLEQMFNNISNIKYPAKSDFVINELTLYESQLTRQGPIYSVLEKYGFSG
ncbi:MAG: RNA 2',3'-cyclic phosphodiesterase [Candidatus Saccharibacteria bacterium]